MIGGSFVLGLETSAISRPPWVMLVSFLYKTLALYYLRKADNGE
jgi:hypothetical protein